jgi:CRP/FNR family cyclic AMP-dependent transcriptional regulator
MLETLEMMQEPRALRGAPRTSRSNDDVECLLEGVAGREVLSLAKGDYIFVEGDPSDSIYFIKKGKVKVTVVSDEGREALLTLLNAPGFVGEECLAGQSLRRSTATTLEPSIVVRVRKQAMLQGVHTHPELCATFVTSLLFRGIDLEDDLCNQLFNVSEKRLAWILIKLAGAAKCGSVPDSRIPWLSHETLAEMVGTTRSRVCRFMNKFRTLDMIEYHGIQEITVRAKMLTDLVLNDR